MRTVKGLVVPASGQPEVRHLTADIETLQGIVGGCIEAVALADVSAHAYCNEEVKLLGLPVNQTATALTETLMPGFAHHVLCGDVVFLGDGPHGEEADVPPAVLASAAMPMA
jgi:hypothetical protein